jgi:hypothetical protein
MGPKLLEERANHYALQVLKLADNSGLLKDVIAAQDAANAAAKKARDLYEEYSGSQ